jgi:hypothetical protein
LSRDGNGTAFIDAFEHGTHTRFLRDQARHVLVHPVTNGMKHFVKIDFSEEAILARPNK